MGTWKHRIKDGVCICCNVAAISVSIGKRGRQLRCPVSKKAGSGYNHRYKNLIEKKICANCGFIPQNICQLDVDHIDNNHKNNDINNLQVLCANCHRLKTHLNRAKASCGRM